MGEEDALLIFPEGGNFSESRRLRAIDRLRGKGMLEQAQRAEAMRHVLPPRPGGVAAALEAAPHADVVFVAHTGLEHLSTVADLWDGLPMDQVGPAALVVRPGGGGAARPPRAGGLAVRPVGRDRHVDRGARSGVSYARRSLRMSTRGKPPETARVSAARTKPHRSNSPRVPTYAMVESTFAPALSTG